MVFSKRIQKATAIIMAWIMLILVVLPSMPVVMAATTIEAYNDPVQAWPSFTPYTDRSGNAIYDPANEPGVSPDDVDFTSGAVRGIGDKPSFYVAGDDSYLFFRIRLLGDPRDDKGGFLSSVWLVRIFQGGVNKATVGLNGKSPHEDYIYVSNANGSVIKYINKTDGSGVNVPGTRVTEDANGDYFLDFQVPISRLTEIDPSITSDSILQFSFATSKAANLTVVNKDSMNGDGVYIKIGSEFSIYSPTISFSNLVNAATAFPGTISGTTTNVQDASQVTLTIASPGNSSTVTHTVQVSNNAWSVTGLTGFTAEGSYVVTASVVNENGDAATISQQVDIGEGSASVTINGAKSYSSFIFPTSFSGGYTRTTGGSRRVNLYIYELSEATPPVKTLITSELNINVTGSPGSWAHSFGSYPPSLVPGKTYRIEAVAANNANLVAVQTIQYLGSNIAITAPVNNTRSLNATPVVSGTANPNTKVEFYINDQLFREIIADENGDWVVEVDRALSPNPNPSSYYQFKALIRDEKGNTLQSVVNYGVDGLNISIENGSHEFVYINNLEPTIRGRSTDTHVNLQISEEGNPGNSFTLSNIPVTNNKWSIKIPPENRLTDNTNYVVIASTVQDPSKTATLNLRVKSATSITITNPAPGSVVGVRSSIMGSSEPNAIIDLNLNNSVIIEVVADENGDWIYTPSSDWNFGTHNLIATTSDEVGNTATAETNFSVNSAAKAITSFDFNGLNPVVIGVVDEEAKTIDLTVPFGTNRAALVPTIVHTGASISPASETSQDFGSPVTYTVTAADGSTQAYVVTVTVVPNSAKAITDFDFAGLDPVVTGTVDEGAKTVALTVPYGTNLIALVPTIVHTGASIAPASGAAQDFGSSVTYTVTAADGSTQDYVITVTVAPNTAKAITSFDFNGLDPVITGTVDEGAKTVALTVPYGTNLTTLVPTIVHTGASIAPASGAAQDFGSPVTYTVTAADGSTQDYVVTVTVAPNTAKAITSFDFNGLSPAVVGVIDEEAKTIALTVPYGTDVAALVPTIVHTGANVAPASGAAQDFGSPVTYTVTAPDGSTQDYVLTVTVATNTAKAITSFDFAGLDPVVTGTVDEDAKTIALTVPYGTDVAALVPTIGHTGASIAPASGAAQDFGSPVTYTVTAADGSTQDYLVTVTVAPSYTVSVSPADDITFAAQTAGYAPVEAETITITRTGTGEITNLAVALIGTNAGNFTLGSLGTTALNEGTPSTTFSVKPNDGLVPGAYTAIVTITGDNGISESFNVSFSVNVTNVMLTLTSDPSVLVGDGISQAILKVELKDEEGNPIPEVEVHFTTDAGTLSATTAITNGMGEATVTLTSLRLEGTTPATYIAKAVVEEPAKGISAEEQIEIYFLPPIIVGQVLDANGSPIAGARVWISETLEDGSVLEIETTTDENGNYSITVPRGGDYIVNIEVTTMVGNQEIIAVFTQQAQVLATGQGDQFKPERKVSGQLFIATRNDSVRNMGDVFPGSILLVQILNDPEGKITATIDNEGKYELIGFEAGQTYQVVFNVEIGGQRLAGKLANIKVGEDGQIVVQHELIDPFGIISDSATGELIPGVKMNLYWADTQLNREYGREPNTLVQLPVLTNFPPNQNNNPQISTEMNPDTMEIGNYAWMVFADGDYYIVGEKAGYVTYDSRNDSTTDVQLGDSWIRNGIIHIGQTIMRYDLSMVMTDEQEVDDTLRNLKIEYEKEYDTWESITSNVYLLRTDAYETDVLWSSSQPTVVNIPEAGSRAQIIEADVVSQITERSVIVTATVSKGAVEKKRTFLLIVKAKGVTKQEASGGKRDEVLGEANIPITRIDVSDGSKIDKLVLDLNNIGDISNVVRNKPEGGKEAIISLTEDKDNKADEYAVEISRTLIAGIAADSAATLKVKNDYVQLAVGQLNQMKDNNLDLFFRIVPIKANDQKQQVITTVTNAATNDNVISALVGGKQVEALGVPLKIETNYSGYATTVIILFDKNGITVPVQNSDAFLNSLAIFIEHNDEQVMKKVADGGASIYYENGLPVGLSFQITKFSTFMVVELKDRVNNNGGGPGFSLPSLNKEITSFTLQGQTIEAIIDSNAGTITIEVAQGTDLSNLIATFTLSPGATATINGVAQISDVTANDFSGQLTYTIRAQDGTQKSWVINIRKKATKSFHEAYIIGYPDGTFKAEQSIKRAEMAAILARVVDNNIKVTRSLYPDVHITHWANQVIEIARQLGLMQGYPDGTFKPEETITRAEMAAVIANWLSLIEIGETPFIDISGHWAQEIIKRVYQAGIMQGYPDGSFRPEKPLTRAEAVTIINKILGRGPLYGMEQGRWPDVSPKHWAFHDIEEASQDHYYHITELGKEIKQ